MPYTIACGDVMPGCQARFSADTKDGVLSQVADHAKEDHGVEEITLDVRTAVESAIRHE